MQRKYVKIKLKYKHEKKYITLLKTHYGTAFEDLKVDLLTIKFKIKV